MKGAAGLVIVATLGGCVGHRGTRVRAVAMNGGLVVGGTLGLVVFDDDDGGCGGPCVSLPLVVSAVAVGLGVLGYAGTLWAYTDTSPRRSCFEESRLDGESKRQRCFDDEKLCTAARTADDSSCHDER